MMTAVIQQKTSLESRPQVPPSVLLVGKKHTLDYVAPALYRLNNTGELIIKATGSLSIVTAVDVAEIVKRDVADIATPSITVGTDELRLATGKVRRMSCIEIKLIKVSPLAVVAPAIDMHVPVNEIASPAIEIPIEESATSVVAGVPVAVLEKTKKHKAKRKPSAAAKKKSAKRKTKSS
jgi:DNA-binding protein Alba